MEAEARVHQDTPNFNFNFAEYKVWWVDPRLKFYRDKIEPLNDNDKFAIFSTNDGKMYAMTKREFYSVFDNVVNTYSYWDIGEYHYSKTPQKASRFVVSTF